MLPTFDFFYTYTDDFFNFRCHHGYCKKLSVRVCGKGSRDYQAIRERRLVSKKETIVFVIFKNFSNYIIVRLISLSSKDYAYNLDNNYSRE